jgi:predicted transcriptional regulator
MSNGEPVLEHETRRMIFNHIIAHPGVSFNILKNVFSLNDSTLRYHLNYLEHSEQISFGLEKGKRQYYPNQNKHIIIRSDEIQKEFFQLTPKQEQIIEKIKQYPGITQGELIRMTGIQRLTLTQNIKKLMDICIVRKVPDKNNVRYEYIENEQLKYEIMKRLVVKLLRHEIDEQKFLELKRKLEK